MVELAELHSYTDSELLQFQKWLELCPIVPVEPTTRNAVINRIYKNIKQRLVPGHNRLISLNTQNNQQKGNNSVEKNMVSVENSNKIRFKLWHLVVAIALAIALFYCPKTYIIRNTFFGTNIKLKIQSGVDLKSYLVTKFGDLKLKLLDEARSLDDSSEKMSLINKLIDEKLNHTQSVLSDILNKQSETIQEYEKQFEQIHHVVKELGDLLSKQISEQDTKNEIFKNNYATIENLEQFVNDKLYLFNADQTGMADYASESIGGRILFTRCTENFDRNKWIQIYGFDTFIPLGVSSRVVIQSEVRPGNCWAFKNDKADLFIKLAASIKPTIFSIEHIAKEISSSGSRISAPKDFKIYGYKSVDDIDKNGVLLGSFVYDASLKQTIQNFKIDSSHEVSVIELKIESNHGNKDFTCLYKIRVHGININQNYQTVIH